MLQRKLIRMKKKIETTIGAVCTVAGSSKVTKTGGWRLERPVIDIEKCIKCAICWYSCPDLAIEWVDGQPRVNLEYCKGCGICAKECPVKCIAMVKEEK